MTNKQAKRLSVDHWGRMLKLTVKDIRAGKEAPYGENCAFCMMYVIPKRSCDGCPVMAKTGLEFCRGTPYYAAHRLYWATSSGSTGLIKQFRAAVRREIEFLESLEV